MVMAKKKILTRYEQLFKERATNIQDFEAPPKADHNYTRVLHYMLTNPNYIKMSSSAKVLLMYMKDWAFASKNYIEHYQFEYSTTMLDNIGVMTNKTQTEALRELEYYGFIKKINNACQSGGFTQIWEFNDEWYKQEKKDYRLIKKYKREQKKKQ